MSQQGLITTSSAHSFAETTTLLEYALLQRKLTLFARIDHAAGAALAEMELRPTTLFIFGNPKAGTPLMLAVQEIGLQLPLKILVWEDGFGRTWLSYDDPAWMARRFSLDPDMPPVVAMSKALAAITDDAGKRTSQARA